jgi:hypothetical protein
MKAIRLWLRWVFANSMGEMVGLGLTFGLGYLIINYLGEMTGLWGTLLSFGLMIATGVVEGLIVGIAQFWGMHPLVHRPDDHRLGIKQAVWLRATILGALLAWFAGSLPFMIINLAYGAVASDVTQSATLEVAAEPPQSMVLLLAACAGLVAGAVLAFFQWRALRRHFFMAGWWVPANSLAWAVGMPLIFTAIDFVFSMSSLAWQIVAFLASLALTGAVVGAIHGVALLLITRKPRSMKPGPNHGSNGSAAIEDLNQPGI